MQVKLSLDNYGDVTYAFPLSSLHPKPNAEFKGTQFLVMIFDKRIMIWYKLIKSRILSLPLMNLLTVIKFQNGGMIMHDICSIYGNIPGGIFLNRLLLPRQLPITIQCNIFAKLMPANQIRTSKTDPEKKFKSDDVILLFSLRQRIV